MSEHTPERLIIREYEAGRVPDKKLVMLQDEENLEGIECVRRPTARRIIACWNACKGIETADLEMDPSVNLLSLHVARADEATALLKAVRARFQHLRLGPDEETVLNRVNAFLDAKP